MLPRFFEGRQMSTSSAGAAAILCVAALCCLPLAAARLLSRIAPEYPDSARNKGIGGTVVLRAVFGAGGILRNILVVGSSDNDLTAASIRAARRIKFIPAQKDGKPVCQFVQIEYNFSVL